MPNALVHPSQISPRPSTTTVATLRHLLSVSRSRERAVDALVRALVFVATGNPALPARDTLLAGMVLHALDLVLTETQFAPSGARGYVRAAEAVECCASIEGGPLVALARSMFVSWQSSESPFESVAGALDAFAGQVGDDEVLDLIFERALETVGSQPCQPSLSHPSRLAA